MCQWPFLSWFALLGAVLLLVARLRLGEERRGITASTPDEIRVESKHIVQSAAEGGHHYEVRFIDREGNPESVRVSKSVYQRTNDGDVLTVHANPTSTGYVHESEPLSFSRASTSILWAFAWVLIFVGVVDFLVFVIIDESPWCLVFG